MSPIDNRSRRYFSARKGANRIGPQGAHWRLRNLFALFRDKDYFKQKLGATRQYTPDTVEREAIVKLGFSAFPIEKWTFEDKTEDHVFDVIEFLFDYVSKPGTLVDMISETNWQYQDYDSFDEEAGKQEFRDSANTILSEMGEGFELGEDGQIRANGTDGLQQMLKAEIVEFDKQNVDDKVFAAIELWRRRHATLHDKKEAIRLLADVFEWLRDKKKLGEALDQKDEGALFSIANNFAIRHHNASQKGNYDQSIWYNWMFHFYLATYHASVRLLLKKQRANTKVAPPTT